MRDFGGNNSSQNSLAMVAILEQKALFTSVLLLLKDYQITVLGDREFCSIELGQWLDQQGLSICLRLRRNEYIRCSNNFTQQLKLLGLKPGMSMFLAGVNVTKQLGFSQFNVACKWKRNYRQKQTTTMLVLINAPCLLFNLLQVLIKSVMGLNVCLKTVRLVAIILKDVI